MPVRPVLAAAVACLLAACSGGPDAGEALAETARAAADPVTARPGQAAFQRDAGEHLVLPADFPVDIVLPEHYAVVSVMTMGPSQSVVLRSDATMATLFEQFRAGQSARGWQETVSMQGVEGAMLGFRKDSRGVLANFRPDMEGRTLVSLSLQPQVPASR